MTTKLTIACSAHTPLFLPLYVAKYAGFYGLGSEYEIHILEPESNKINGDEWALSQVQGGKATFSICDPTMADQRPTLQVIGTVLNRAAFWLISRGSRPSSIDDLQSVRHLFTYPKNMTADRLTRVLLKSRLHRSSKLENVPVDEEVERLASLDDPQYAALTANWLKAYAAQKADSELHVTPLWELEPRSYHFLLSGIVTHKKVLRDDQELAMRFVTAMYKGIASVWSHLDTAMAVIAEEFPEYQADEAKKVVAEFASTRLYPVTPFVDFGSWNNAFEVRHGSGQPFAANRNGGRKSRPARSRWNAVVHSHRAGVIRRAYDDRVDNRFSEDAEREAFELIVDFGQGKVHEETWKLVKSFEYREREIWSVVGAYCRYDEAVRNVLKSFVQQVGHVLMYPIKGGSRYLLSGASGTGKTFLLEQLAVEVPQAELVLLNVLEMSREDVEGALARIKEPNTPILCVVDEVDAEKAADWLFEAIYENLEALGSLTVPVVYVFIGSSGADAVELRKSLHPRRKAPDVLSRIRELVTIPPLALGDMLITLLSTMEQLANERGMARVSVERFAAYYLLSSPMFNQTARGIALRAKECAYPDTQADTLALSFERVVAAGEKAEFIRNHIRVFSDLSDCYIQWNTNPAITSK